MDGQSNTYLYGLAVAGRCDTNLLQGGLEFGTLAMEPVLRMLDMDSVPSVCNHVLYQSMFVD